MRLRAVVPINWLAVAKSRLAGTGVNRPGLVLSMATHVLDLLVRSPEIDEVLVVSPQADLRGWAVASGARFHRQLTEGLNPALEEVRALYPSEAMLVVLPDLPRLRASELERFLENWEQQTVLAAPDHWGRGTNLLLSHPPERIPFRFGPDSLAAHRLAAGDHFRVFWSPGTEWDLDTPDQLVHAC